MDLETEFLKYLPTWVIIAFVIGKLVAWLWPILAPTGLQAWWTEVKRHRAHHDQMEEVKLNAKLQEVAAEQAQKVYSENILFDMLAHSQEFQEQLLLAQADAFRNITIDLKLIATELKHIAMTGQRQNDLLTTMNIQVTRLTDKFDVMSKKANGQGEANG